MSCCYEPDLKLHIEDHRAYVEIYFPLPRKGFVKTHLYITGMKVHKFPGKVTLYSRTYLSNSGVYNPEHPTTMKLVTKLGASEIQKLNSILCM